MKMNRKQIEQMPIVRMFKLINTVGLEKVPRAVLDETCSQGFEIRDFIISSGMMKDLKRVPWRIVRQEKGKCIYETFVDLRIAVDSKTGKVAQKWLELRVPLGQGHMPHKLKAGQRVRVTIESSSPAQ